MRSNRRLSRATLVVPVILALSHHAGAADDPPSTSSQFPTSPQPLPPLPLKASPAVPTKVTNPGLASPYRSQGASTYPSKSNPLSSSQQPIQASNPFNTAPYRSAGPAAPTNLSQPQSSSQDSNGLPSIGQVASPYRSEGPSALAVLGSSQVASGHSTGASYLGAGGTMSAPSPYESTAAPGTTSPFAIPPAGANANQGQSPASLFAANNAAGGAADPAAGSGGAPSSGLGGFPAATNSAFAMIGDASPLVGTLANGNVQQPPSPNARSIIAPSVRGFKIAENQSPVPQDRFFFSFNYYNNINKTLNNFYSVPIKGVNIYRYVFGFEKTFNDGMGSVGIRLPIDNVFAQSRYAGVAGGGNATATGDLTVYLKHILAINRETGSLVSAGVAISPQTAPLTFGGARFLAKSNTTTIQPFLALLYNFDRFYIQGFSALDVPVDPAQPTLYYNDLGIGYFIYRDNESTAMITAIAPTFEVHVNSPINHSGAYNRFDNFGTPDIVNLTTGLNTRFWQSSTLTMGAVVPVTGPKPFAIEGTVLLNIYFGPTRRNPAPPIIGG